MKILIIVIVILVLIASPAAGNISRDFSMQADGRVDLHSITFNDYVKTGLRVTGDGIAQLDSDLVFNRANLDQVYNIQMQAKEDTLRPIEAVTAMTSADGKGQHDYAVKIAPDAGEQAMLQIHYLFSALDADDDELELGEMVFVFSELEIDTTAQVSMGEFRSHTHIRTEDGEGYIEDIRVRDGQTVFEDYVSVDRLREVEIEVDVDVDLDDEL